MNRVRNLFRPVMAAAPLFALAVAPRAAAAQQAPQVPAEVQEWIAEIQQVQAQLEPVQVQALQEPEIQAQQAQVVAAVMDVMVAADPANAERIERMEAIVEEAQAAQQAGDGERIAALTAEASTLQPRIQAAQADALAHPEVEPKLQAFQHTLHERMVEIDPEARQRLDRIAELQEKVGAVMNGGG